MPAFRRGPFGKTMNTNIFKSIASIMIGAGVSVFL